jgi:hypothetical protein
MLRLAEPRHASLFAALLWIALATPWLRAALEARMVWHMLVQLALLAGCGYVLGRAWLASYATGRPDRALSLVQSFNAGGCTGLVAASFVMLLWMLPRSLDLARLDVTIDALKYLSVPAAGLAIALSWPRLPAIARAVVHLEVVATLLRFGWGYMAAEERLCLVYLAADQQLTGELLLWLGAAYAVAVAWRPLFGTGARFPHLHARART